MNTRTDTNMLNFTIVLIDVFAARYGLEIRQAFNYLNRFQGMQFLCKHYNTLHTLSFDEAIDNLIDVCKQNGGELA